MIEDDNTEMIKLKDGLEHKLTWTEITQHKYKKLDSTSLPQSIKFPMFSALAC
jgi:hypothetical protein